MPVLPTNNLFFFTVTLYIFVTGCMNVKNLGTRIYIDLTADSISATFKPICKIQKRPTAGFSPFSESVIIYTYRVFQVSSTDA